MYKEYHIGGIIEKLVENIRDDYPKYSITVFENKEFIVFQLTDHDKQFQIKFDTIDIINKQCFYNYKMKIEKEIHNV